MGNIKPTASPQPLVNAQQTQNTQAQAAKKDESTTILEKFGDTELGTFYKDSPVLSGVATGITGLGVIGLGVKYEGLGEMLFSRGTGGVLAAGIGGVLAQDGIKDIKDGKTFMGATKTTVGAVGVLGGVELLTKIPVLTKPFEIAFKNGYAAGGVAAGVGSAYLIKNGVEDIQDGKKLTGGLKAAGGAAGALGATELIGRQFGKSLIIEPLVKFATSKGAQGTGAVLGSVAGAGLVVDGAQRLASNGNVLSDGLGVAEVAGGALLGAGSVSLGGVAFGSAALQKVLPQAAKHIGSAALVGTTYVLGKEAVHQVKENGLSYLGTAAGTGAALSALGAAETFGFSKAFTSGGGEMVAAAGIGIASGILAKDAFVDIKNGKYHEGALKGFGALVGAGSAMALADVPGVRDVGKSILKGSWEGVIAPVGEFALKNPLVSIPLAVGGAYAIYKLTDDGDKKAAPPTAEGGTSVVEAAKAATTKVEE